MKDIVLASQSPRREELLKQIGIVPKHIFAVDANETPKKRELPKQLAKRLAKEKSELAKEQIDYPCFLITADTVVGVGRRILPKAEEENQARQCLKLMSGRAHRVYTGVCVVSPKGEIREKVVETKVKFKRLSEWEINQYIKSKEWRGKAGGYAIQGKAEVFITQIMGSYSNVVGLPVRETLNLLVGLGYKE